MLTPAALAVTVLLWATSIGGLVTLLVAWWQWSKRSGQRQYEATALGALTLALAVYPGLFAISKAHWIESDILRAVALVVVLSALLSAYAVVIAFTRVRGRGRALRASSIAFLLFYGTMCTLAIYASFHNGEI